MFDRKRNIFESVREDDESAFREVFGRYAERLYLWANTLLHDHQVSQDIVQAFFVRYWEKRHDLHFNDSTFQIYAFRSIHNAVLNHLRFTKRFLDDFEINIVVDENSDLDEKAIEEINSSLRAAIDKLPDRCKEIFTMAKIEKKSYSSIARQLGISENTVKVQVSRAYKILRNEIKIES